MYFPVYVLEFCPYTKNFDSERKPLYLHILCKVQLSLLVNLGTIFFSDAHAEFGG